jgi:hypothetical protein
MVALLLCACSAPRRPQVAPGAAPLGLPQPAAPPAPSSATPLAERAEPDLPEILTLPAVYRLMLVDGRLALVRESDARSLRTGSSSLRIVSGEGAGADPSYQPAPLSQELAAELAASRQRSERLDGALESVMQRSRELSEQALELEAQGKRLAELLAASEARVRKLEAEPDRAPAGRQAAPPPAGPGP